MEAKQYNQDGKELGTITLSDAVFGLPWNADLVNQVVLSMQSSARKPIAHTKDRGEVRGGGKKPWKQKGTGRSRHGSIRSPIWKGGGVAHGPRNERDYEKKINKKMKTKALFTILSQKLREGEVVFLNSLSVAEKKTKNAQAVVSSLAKVKGLEPIGYKRGSRALFAVPTYSESLVTSFRNLPAVSLEEVRNLNPVEVLAYKYLVIADPETAEKALTARKS